MSNRPTHRNRTTGDVVTVWFTSPNYVIFSSSSHQDTSMDIDEFHGQYEPLR